MDFDSIVIGAGVVGLAVARRLAMSGREVLVLERHCLIGQEISSRNSEVIHAGIYYPAGSLKAGLCVRGREMLYRYCASHKVAHRKVGKLIVAADEAQEAALEAIYRKGCENGVNDLQYLAQDILQEMEPQLKARRAIWSPSTGIINCHELMMALESDLCAAGGSIAFDSPLLRGRVVDGGFEVIAGADATAVSCRELVNCGGLGAQAASHSIEGIPGASIPPLYLSRGCYFSMSGQAPFRHLIYPLPNNEGLGVHLTLDLAGNARFGPDTEWIDTIDYTVDPKRVESFYSSIRAYYPNLKTESLQPDYAGIRPKIAGPRQLAADFRIDGVNVHAVKGFVGLYGIESPGLTASMAIAEHTELMLEQR